MSIYLTAGEAPAPRPGMEARDRGNQSARRELSEKKKAISAAAFASESEP